MAGNGRNLKDISKFTYHITANEMVIENAKMWP